MAAWRLHRLERHVRELGIREVPVLQQADPHKDMDVSTLLENDNSTPSCSRSGESAAVADDCSANRTRIRSRPDLPGRWQSGVAVPRGRLVERTGVEITHTFKLIHGSVDVNGDRA